MCRDLTAKLGTDGSATAGDEDGLSFEHGEYFVIVDLDRISSEKVDQFNIFKTVNADFTIGQLIYTREHAYFCTGLLTDVQDLFSVFRGSRRHREDNGADIILGSFFDDHVTSADDRNAIKLTADLTRIIVDDAYGSLVLVGIVLQFTKKNTAGGTAADDHDVLCVTCTVFRTLAELISDVTKESVRETYEHMKNEREEDTEEIERSRHVDLHDVLGKDIADGNDAVRLYHSKGLIDTYI